MRFFSDNAAPVCPQVLDAIARANTLDTAYDGDRWSAQLDGVFSDLFERAVRVLWVPSGTSANCLALAALCPPYGGVVCHREAHIQNDEAGAPAFYTHGATLILGEGPGAKLTPDAIRAAVAGIRADVHQVQPHAVSITNATEYGLSYTPEEVAAIGDLCRTRGWGLHMDGARFANAVARLGCSPAELTWRSGVDILSFGATKNGGALCDAIVVFNPEIVDGLAVQLRRAGQVWSKMRFASAQLLAYVENGLWLRMAHESNAVAARIAAGLAGIPGVSLIAPVEANELFVEAEPATLDALAADGFLFYRRSPTLGRFVCRFDCADTEAEALVAALRRHAPAPAQAAQ